MSNAYGYQIKTDKTKDDIINDIIDRTKPTIDYRFDPADKTPIISSNYVDWFNQDQMAIINARQCSDPGRGYSLLTYPRVYIQSTSTNKIAGFSETAWVHISGSRQMILRPIIETYCAERIITSETIKAKYHWGTIGTGIWHLLIMW
jgi:hypothetical protein